MTYCWSMLARLWIEIIEIKPPKTETEKKKGLVR